VPWNIQKSAGKNDYFGAHTMNEKILKEFFTQTGIDRLEYEISSPNNTRPILVNEYRPWFYFYLVTE
jgi:hypothetical protein